MAATAGAPLAEEAARSTSLTSIQGILRSYLFIKTVKALFTVWVVITLTFFLIRLLPGNPVEMYMNELIVQYSMTYEEAQDQAAALFNIDLDRPLLLQYTEYMGKLLQGDLGKSVTSPGTTVNAIIAKHLPWTVFSVGLALMISFGMGMAIGILMAYWRNSLFDHVMTVLASIFSSIPNYLVGILILVWFGVQLRILPIAQMRGALSPGMVPASTWPLFRMSSSTPPCPSSPMSSPRLAAGCWR